MGLGKSQNAGISKKISAKTLNSEKIIPNIEEKNANFPAKLPIGPKEYSNLYLIIIV